MYTTPASYTMAGQKCLMTCLSSLHTRSIDFLRTYKGGVTGMQFELPIPKNVGFMLKNAYEIWTKRFEHRIGVVGIFCFLI